MLRPEFMRGMRSEALGKAIVFVWAMCCLAAFTPAARADELILCGWDEVFILNVAGSRAISTNKVWSWKTSDRADLPAHRRDKFRSTDECKPVESGRKILITSSGGGVALVERATKKTLFYGFVGNAHSAEMLPGDRIVVAGSRHTQGNCLAVFDVRQPEKIVYSEPLDSGHGAVWDDARQLLWALGYEQLKALRLKDWKGTQPKLQTAAVYELPAKSGHDLVAVPRTDELLLTTGRGVFLFDRERRTFRPHPELGDITEVKSIAIHPASGQIVYTRAEGTNWWTARLRMMNPAGEIQLPGERLYKVRWNVGR